jgi:sensor c-di-GMP phosphodiesterase-like protein
MRGEVRVKSPLAKFVWLTLRLATVVLVCSAIGLAIGLGVAYKLTERKLDRYAHNLLHYAEAYNNEIATTLDLVNASGLSFCSDEEIARMRTLVFQGHLVKEIGRVRDGKLYCTSANGRLEQPWPQPRPDIVTPSGRKV